MPIVYSNTVWDWRIVTCLGALLKDVANGENVIPAEIASIRDERLFLLKEALMKSGAPNLTSKWASFLPERGASTEDDEQEDA